MEHTSVNSESRTVEELELKIQKIEENIQKIQKEKDDLQVMNDYYALENERLRELIINANRKKYDRTSDNVDKRQMSIFNEAEEWADEKFTEPKLPEETKTPQKKSEKRRRGKSWLNDSEAVKHTEKIIDVPDSVKQKYDKKLRKIGVNKKQVLEYHPGYLEVTTYCQNVYEVTGVYTEDGKAVIVKGEMPKTPLGKSYASASVLSKVITDKFDKGIPFHRQERIGREMGIDITKQVMANWLIQLNEQYFSTIGNFMHQKIINGHHIIADETRCLLLHEKESQEPAKGWMWAIMNGRSEKDKLVYMKFYPDRHFEHAPELMPDFDGILLSDALGGYDRIEDAVRARDWTHARRKFNDAPNAAPKSYDVKNSFSAKIVSLMNKLFRYDKKLDPEKMSPEEIVKERKLRQEPIVDEIFKLIKGSMPQIPEGIMLHKACTYALNQEEGLRKYLDDGRIEITSNIIEREMKAFSIPRKNFLFMNSERGADASSNIYSVMRSAVINGLDPEKYMTYLLEQLPEIDVHDDEQLNKVMPWSDLLPEDLKSRSRKKQK